MIELLSHQLLHGFPQFSKADLTVAIRVKLTGWSREESLTLINVSVPQLCSLLITRTAFGGGKCHHITVHLTLDHLDEAMRSFVLVCTKCDGIPSRGCQDVADISAINCFADLFEGVPQLFDSDHVCCLSEHLGTHQFDKVFKVHSAATSRERKKESK